MRAARHWRLDHRVGWRSTLASDGVQPRARLELASDRGRARSLFDGSFGGFTEAGTVAKAEGGETYVLNPAAATLERFDVCAQRSTRVPHVGGTGSAPRQFSEPSALAFDGRGDLVVVDAGNRRLQVFAPKGWTLRRVVGPLRFDATRARLVPTASLDRAWRPFALARGHRDELFVTDRSGHVHVFDRAGTHLRSWPVSDPSHIAVDLEGRVYVVSEGTSVMVFSAQGVRAHAISDPAELADRFCPVPAATEPEAHSDRGAALVREGRFVAGPLDGRRERCVWHRIVLEGDVPAGSRVEVRAFTSDAEGIAAPTDASAWALCGVRGPGTGAWDCLVQAPAGRFLHVRLELHGTGDVGPRISAILAEYPRRSSADLLPALYKQDALSWTFLERFMAISDAALLPMTDVLGRFTEYLSADAVPADPDNPSGDFLAWLSGWLGVAARGDFSVAQRRALLRGAPELFTWRGTLRGLRAHVRLYTGIEPSIVEHYRLRRWLFLGSSRLGDCGEVFGSDILGALEVGTHSTVGEFSLRDRTDPRSDPLRLHAHRFTVYAPSARPLTPSQLATLEQIVAQAKPAHTAGNVVPVGPRMSIGKQARVGVNTVVAAYPSGVTAGKTRLGQASVLSPSPDESQPPTFRIGARSRIGTNTLID